MVVFDILVIDVRRTAGRGIRRSGGGAVLQALSAGRTALQAGREASTWEVEDQAVLSGGSGHRGSRG